MATCKSRPTMAAIAIGSVIVVSGLVASRRCSRAKCWGGSAMAMSDDATIVCVSRLGVSARMELCVAHAMSLAVEVDGWAARVGSVAPCLCLCASQLMSLSVEIVGVTGRGGGAVLVSGAKKVSMSARGFWGAAIFFLGGPSPMSLLENSFPKYQELG
jgi:hypothetical protein